MRIGVIADTHGKLPERLVRELRAADEIWHLGDFCDSKMLSAILAIGPVVRAVAGNNDIGLDLPEELEMEDWGWRFRLVHIRPRELRCGEILLCGHTHVPCDEVVGGARVLNPGTVGKPNKGSPPSWAWLRLTSDGSLEWEVNRI